MCGFTFCVSKSKINLSEIKKMNRLIKHRGPDTSGFVNSKNFKHYKNKHVNFAAGFQRLKIIDLSKKASQPMIYKDRYLIVFNGEIYNYLEIKQILKKKGYRFKSNSDTEIILASYDFWGEGCFKKFNGMWSLIIVDLKNEIIIASRDRYGVKPLYYRKHKDSIYFGSEIKQLKFLTNKNYINKNKFYFNLVNNYFPISNKTIFKDIFQLKAGEKLKFDIKKFEYKINNWYNFKSKNHLQNKFKKNLDQAINLRLRSDVKIGISLSGGLDSSTIASIIANNKKNNHRKIYTFSTRSNDDNDEFEYVKKFVKKYNYKNIPINLTFRNFRKNLLRMVKNHDLPINNLSVFSEWEIFRNMKKYGIKVNLDGHGADEQLCGYEKYYSLYCLQLLKNFSFIKLYIFFAQIFKSEIPNKSKFVTKILFNFFPTFIKRKIKIYLNNEINPNWINFKTHNLKKSDKSNNLVLNENFNQFFITSLPHQLYWSDINSMTHSIETRSPFLDFNLVESTLLSNMNQKIVALQNKFVLRKNYKKILPKEIYNRYFKVGFTAPGQRWLIKNRKEVRKLFNDSFKYLDTIISIECKKNAMNIIDGKTYYKDWIWKIIFLGLWMKVHRLNFG